MDMVYKHCYEIYEADIKIFRIYPKQIADQANPQIVFDEMKEKSLSKVIIFYCV